MEKTHTHVIWQHGVIDGKNKFEVFLHKTLNHQIQKVCLILECLSEIGISLTMLLAIFACGLAEKRKTKKLK